MMAYWQNITQILSLNQVMQLLADGLIIADGSVEQHRQENGKIIHDDIQLLSFALMMLIVCQMVGRSYLIK